MSKQSKSGTDFGGGWVYRPPPGTTNRGEKTVTDYSRSDNPNVTIDWSDEPSWPHRDRPCWLDEVATDRRRAKTKKRRK